METYAFLIILIFLRNSNLRNVKVVTNFVLIKVLVTCKKDEIHTIY